MKLFLNKTDLKQVRSILRDALKRGNLESRRTYYDYYDSCHSPSETPNAPWVKGEELITIDRLKAGGDSISSLGNGIFQLWTGYSRYEVRIKNGN